jgi:hypothetical protein
MAAAAELPEEAGAACRELLARADAADPAAEGLRREAAALLRSLAPRRPGEPGEAPEAPRRLGEAPEAPR